MNQIVFKRITVAIIMQNTSTKHPSHIRLIKQIKLSISIYAFYPNASWSHKHLSCFKWKQTLHDSLFIIILFDLCNADVCRFLFVFIYTHTHTVYQSIDFIVMNTVIFTVCHYKIIKETEGESLQDDSMKGVSR